MLSRLLKRLLKRLKNWLFVDEVDSPKDEEVTSNIQQKTHAEILAEVKARHREVKIEQPSVVSMPYGSIHSAPSRTHPKPSIQRNPSRPTSSQILSDVKRMSAERHQTVVTQRTDRDDVFDIATGIVIGSMVTNALNHQTYQPEQTRYQEPERYPETEQVYVAPEPEASSDWSTTDSSWNTD